MRIKLEKGKQKELILLAKKEKTWKELSIELNINQNYLANDLKSERILISEDLYNKLCKLSKNNFEKYILKKLEDNWGKSKGGLNSQGSKIELKTPKLNKEIAEFIGAVLGDGNINFYKKGKKIGVYQIKIAGDYKLDEDYHTKYLKRLSEKIFNLKATENLRKIHNERFLVISSKELIEFFIKMGLRPGNKIKNQSTIPEWIWNKDSYLKACIRGLIDTDGCVHRMSKRDSNLIRINFTNHNKTLLEDTRNAFIKLGFNPSKIINNRQFYVSRQIEITKYLKEIGFSNKKHQDRFLKLKSPIV